MTQLYLIRHGQANCNIPPFTIVAGMRGDEGLTSLGRMQAMRLRDRLAASGEIRADILIASTLPRARQTAEIIAPALGQPVLWDDDLQELRVGEADGMQWEDYKATYGLANFRHDPFRPFAPGGENWPQFVMRVGATLHRIVREHQNKTIVLVCHGGFIDSSFNVFFGLHTLALPPVELHTHNTSITHWEQHIHEDQSTRWRLVRYNDDLHVRDIATEGQIPWAQLAPRVTAAVDEPAVPLPVEDLAE